MLRFTALGVLLLAAPLFSQLPVAADPKVVDAGIRWFLMDENRADVQKALGPPRTVATFGQDFESWQYQFDVADHDDFSHQIVFRSSGKLVSITRNYDPERNVDVLFPEAETKVYSFPNPEKPEFQLRLRELSGGRVLMAMGNAQRGKPTGQLVLMRETELRYFYPWVLEQMTK